MSQLRSQRLRKRYKSRTVVSDVSLEVSSGEVVGLLGPNGAGKTTCFYMIVGLVPADAGSIHLDATELTHLPIHRRASSALMRFASTCVGLARSAFSASAAEQKSARTSAARFIARPAARSAPPRRGRA